jgi:hypothetical protein
MRTGSLIVAVGLSSFAAGCTARGTIKNPEAPLPPEPVMLEVLNHTWLDMAIYVVNGSQRFRVMTVVATNAASVVLPRHLLGHSGEIRLQADPVGDGRRFTSERVLAYPGSTITWTLETDLLKSNVEVWLS